MTRGDTGPLAGVRVLDLTHFVAGPWCTMLMADLGADVLKVEPAGRGEISRGMGSVYDEHGDSAIYLGFNRGKRSVALDLKTDAGRDVVHRMAREADAVVQNFRPDVAARLGVDAPTLRALKPGLVCCAVSAFGENGPLAKAPGNDPLIQGISGAMLATTPGQPVRLGVSVPDFAGGLLAAIGVLAALWQRRTTGTGSTLTMNLLDAQLYAQTDLLADPCADPGGRVEARGSGWVWVDADGAVEVPVAGLGEALGRATGSPAPKPRMLALRPADDDRSRATRVVRTPLEFDPPLSEPTRHPPGIGQHTDEVLHELGYDAEETAALRREGVVG